MWFFDTRCLCLTSTNKWKSCPILFYFVVREIYGSDKIIREKYKSDHNLPEKKIRKGAGGRLSAVFTCGSNTRLKFQVETRKIERRIAVLPLLCSSLLVYCIWIVLGPYLLRGDEMGSATDIDRLIVSSSGLYTNFHLTWSGTTDFWSCHTDFKPKMPSKVGSFVRNFELSWISRRYRVGFPNCLDLHICTKYCATVSASNFQVLICSAWRSATSGSYIRFLADPARTDIIYRVRITHIIYIYTHVLLLY